jgi:hypothetical protein
MFLPHPHCSGNVCSFESLHKRKFLVNLLGSGNRVTETIPGLYAAARARGC